MRCKKCGKKLRSGEKFCTICGTYNDDKSIEEIADEVTKAEEDEDTNDKNIRLDVEEKQLPEYKAKTTKVKKEPKIQEEEIFDYQEEKFLEAYIGEDYRIIKKSKFNIYAFILSWMYVLYRKMYAIGIGGLVLTGVAISLGIKFIIGYIILSMVGLGFGFNKLYILVSKKKMSLLLDKYEESDSYTLEEICSNKGGVDFKLALIIYCVFLLLLLSSMFTISYNKNHNTKYWHENSEYQATCNSLIKTAYNSIQTDSMQGKITEGACVITNSSTNEYEIYLKNVDSTNVIYIYFKAKDGQINYIDNSSDINDLETKSATGTITEKEKESLKAKKQIEDDYYTIVKKTREEDELISKKKNQKVKTHYILTRDEITM